MNGPEIVASHGTTAMSLREWATTAEITARRAGWGLADAMVPIARSYRDLLCTAVWMVLPGGREVLVRRSVAVPFLYSVIFFVIVVYLLRRIAEPTG